jgi:hypothetical protein
MSDSEPLTEITVRLQVGDKEYAIGSHVEPDYTEHIGEIAQKLAAYLERTLIMVLTEAQP